MNFEQWLVSIGKSHKTAKNYSGAIKGGLSNWSVEAGLVEGSLSEIATADGFRQVCRGLRQLDIYQARNTAGNGMYNAALNNYADYLAEITQNDLEQDIGQIVEDQLLTNTEKATLVNTRVGQGKFRKQLIEQWCGCAVTGYSDTRFLVASHIKPWSEADNHERLDPFNGLLLLPNLDKVFDLGYISFEATGGIRISGELEDTSLLGITANMTVQLHRHHHGYMEYHRDVKFKP